MTLGDRLAGRDNNLNLIRVIAAGAVLVSHAWPISLGRQAEEPLERLLGFSLGHLAVLVFFAASGYLITASLLARPSLGGFLLARVARLVPGLAASLLVVAFLLGPAVTNLPLGSYLSDPSTGSFLARNITLAFPQYTLPGVFETNPYPAVEGSIWTLAHEVACYAGVVILGLLGLLRHRGAGTAALIAFIVVATALPQTGLPLHPKVAAFLGLAPPFAFGMIACLWRDRLPMSPLPAFLLAGGAAATTGTPLYPAAVAAAVAYATLFLAVAPAGPLAAYARAGDYSYGLYIYAFPVQGLVIWLWGPMSPLSNIALSLPLTLALAIPSWHLIEKPALIRTRRRVATASPAAGIPAAPSFR